MKKTITILILYLFSGLVPSLSLAESFSGKVVGVTDGDTISVMRDGKVAKIRIAWIDAPEKKQAFGNRAKQLASDLAFGKIVNVNVVDIDRWGRLVGEVGLPGGADFSREMVKAGMEEAARSARVGLWKDANPIPPWEFRKKPKTLKP